MFVVVLCVGEGGMASCLPHPPKPQKKTLDMPIEVC